MASKYDARWSKYVEASTSETRRRLALRPGDRLLDAGCGTGTLLAYIQEHEADVESVGVDISRAMLSRAHQRLDGRVHLVQGDVGELPFATGVFDVAVSNSSFHYWPDPRSALREITRVLRPGGRLVLTDWCADYLTTRMMDRYVRLTRATHRTYRSSELAALLERAGYRVAIDCYKINALWGLMTATAVRE